MMTSRTAQPGDVTRFSDEEDRFFLYTSVSADIAAVIAFYELSDGQLSLREQLYGVDLYVSELVLCRS